MSLSPHHKKTAWSTIRGKLCEILIIPAVKICKQCLQTASHLSGNFVLPDPLPRLRPWTPMGDFGPLDPKGCSSWRATVNLFPRVLHKTPPPRSGNEAVTFCHHAPIIERRSHSNWLTHIILVNPDSVSSRPKSIAYFEYSLFAVPLITDKHVTAGVTRCKYSFIIMMMKRTS